MPRESYGFAVIETPSIVNDKVKIEKVLEYWQEYATHTYKLKIYWNYSNQFIQATPSMEITSI